MRLVINELERTDSRVLGALRCIDAITRSTITEPLTVTIDGARLQRNRSGLFVIAQADEPSLAAHAAAFDEPPAAPPIGTVLLTARITDPSGRYLPRLAAVALPRDALPANAATAGSLFRPIEISMFPASVAPVGINWSVLRVSVTESVSGDALGGALVIVTSGAVTLARGLTDWRGEALVPVAGVPVTTWSDDPGVVVVTEIAAQVQVVFDPALGTRTTRAALRAGRAPAAPPAVDPDSLEARRAALPNLALPTLLATGRSAALSFPLALP